MHISRQTISRQKGFILIEALVAFMVVSIGMLGMASLQSMSIKASSTASLRSAAVIKVEEILERMRSNRTALSDYIVGAGGAGVNHGCDDLTGTIKTCLPTELAQYDIFQWKQGLVEQTDNITGSVDVLSPAAPGQGLSTVTVTVSWQQVSSVANVMENMSYSQIASICGAITC